ncbi:MAG: helix-turn-helix domain-containing protein [Alphaproteobacteria bacterium]|nr:helix-turn-helix domain-containing protein [Alphaproteobacteria bacterium]OJV45199.1 MAG: hypothetical protein BGO28_00140 [Alphaproteobacteria bacterium 43-37]
MTQHYAYTKDNKATRLMSEHEVARMLNISPGTLRNQRSKKIGLPYVKVKNRIFYRQEDVINFASVLPVASGSAANSPQ